MNQANQVAISAFEFLLQEIVDSSQNADLDHIGYRLGSSL